MWLNSSHYDCYNLFCMYLLNEIHKVKPNQGLNGGNRLKNISMVAAGDAQFYYFKKPIVIIFNAKLNLNNKTHIY